MNHLPYRKPLVQALGGAVFCAALTALAACAGSLPVPAAPAPADIPQLRAELARDSSRVPVLVRLGAAERAAGHPQDALPLLERAHALQPSDPAAVAYLGLTHEDLSQPARARDLYREYLRIGHSSALKKRLQQRFPLLRHQELVLAAKRDIANEAALTGRPPEPRSVAVFPFVYLGSDPALEPLGRALTELLVTDLGQVDRLHVLERARVQVLLDEMSLAKQGLVDSTTAARSGRLLGAANVVQGQIGGSEDQLQLRAAVVPVTQPASAATLSENDPLRSLFDMQKRLSLGVLQRLGIELTPAERDRVLHRPTASLEALLAYGRCLEAGDAGDYAAASTQCADAARLDPGFSAARAAGARMTELSASTGTSTNELGQLAGAELNGAQSLEALDALQRLVPEPIRRSPALEVEGREGGSGAQTGVIEIIIQPPVGD
ncbi:MAG TPA: tetratricopeptide repeat protein [Longimicrobiaceae bacterium]|nr:tetratricopeptide repeat protein [Longimicrobiaceae bacterium]